MRKRTAIERGQRGLKDKEQMNNRLKARRAKGRWFNSQERQHRRMRRRKKKMEKRMTKTMKLMKR
jgi:hypothetical protein